MISRAELRSRMRRERRSLCPAERGRRAERLARQLTGSGLLWRGTRIAGYWANDGEMELGPLIARIREMGKQIYLPALHGRRLRFLPLEPGCRLVRNRFGIPEPALPPTRAWPVQTLDLVLVPLVAFDDHGNRLGMGGGYYDRTFGYLRDRRHWCVPPLIGVAYEFQRLPALARRPWDIPLRGVVTERGVRLFPRAA